MARTSFEFYHNSKSKVLDVVIHGGDYDINTSFMQKVFNSCKEVGHSVIAFNFPYIERGEEKSSGPELLEELATLQNFLDYSDYKSFEKVRFVAKSLGAIVASFYLDKIAPEESNKFSIVALGYVVGSVRLKNFKGEIAIIQGEKDKFGDINVVKDDLKDAKSRDIRYFEIKGADHSYKDPETKEPVYVDEAVEILKSLEG